MRPTDITVRGAGVFGLSIAYACARRGARVTVIDPHGIGAGASGGVVGALAPHAPEGWNDLKAFQLAGLLAAPDWWAGVAAAGGGDPGFARIGRLQPLADAVAVARAQRVRAADFWPSDMLWQVEPASGDWGLATPTGLVLRDSLSARLDPRGALASLARGLRALGGQVVTDAPDQGAVIHATGAAGLAELSAALGRDIGRPVKGQAALLAFDGRGLPQVYADGIYLVPHADGTTAIGSTSETAWASDAPDAQLDALLTRARALAPVLRDASLLERWAGFRPRARTRQPVLGAWPNRPGHFVANGGFKIGFALAPVVGQAMSDLVLDGRQTFPAVCRL